MFCMKCGAVVKDGDKFCEACGAKIEYAESVPVTETAGETVVLEQPIPVEDTVGQTVVLSDFEPQYAEESYATYENYPTPEEPTATEYTGENYEAYENYAAPEECVAPEAPAKRNGKGKFVLIGLGAVVAALAVCAVFLWDYVENFAVKTFSSPQGYYHYVENKNVEQLSTSVGTIVGNFNNTSDIGFESNVKLQVGDKLIDYIVSETGIDRSDISWASDIGFKYNGSLQGKNTAFNSSFMLADKTAFDMNFVVDSENMCCYMCIPQLNSKFIKVDLSSTDSDDLEEMTETFEILETVMKNMPDSEKTADILNRYLTVAVEAIDDVEQESVTVKANGVSQSCVELTVTLDDSAVRSILKAVLKEFENDKEIEKIIKDIIEKTTDEDADDMYDDILDGVDMLLDNVKSVDFDESIDYIVYVNGKGEVIGRELKSKDLEFEISYLATHDGSDVGSEFIADIDGEKLEVLGSGEVKSGKLNAEYTASFSGVKLLNFTVKNHDVDSAEEGYYNGTYVITLPSETCSLIEKNLNVSGDIADALKEASIELVLKSSEKSVSASIAVNHKGEMLAKITVDSKTVDSFDVKAPDNFVSVDDITGLEKYAESADVDGFINSIIAAGVPNDLIDSIKNAVNGGNNGYDDDFGYDYDSDFDFDYDYDSDFDFGYDYDYDFDFDDDFSVDAY